MLCSNTVECRRERDLRSQKNRGMAVHPSEACYVQNSGCFHPKGSLPQTPRRGAGLSHTDNQGHIRKLGAL